MKEPAAKVAPLPCRFVDIAAIVIELGLNDGVVDHFNHRVQTEVDGTFAIVNIDLVESGLGSGDTGFPEDVGSHFLMQEGAVVEIAGER